MRKSFFIFSLLIISLASSAQLFNYGGYIGLNYISGNTYQVTVTLYSNSNLYDSTTSYCYNRQDTLRLYYGDGTSALLYRSNGPIILPDTVPVGDTLCDCKTLSIYTGTHTFPGAGAYTVWYNAPIFIGLNIVNVPNTTTATIYLINTLIVGPFGNIASATIPNALICTYGCTNECYYFNYNAIAPAGDSISYAMSNGFVAQGYFIPPGAVVDPVTGTVSWCNPTYPGQYLLAVNIITYSPTHIAGKTTEKAIDTMETHLYVIINSGCPTGINELTTSSEYSIYPNPTNNTAYINSTIEESGLITIYNVLGQAINSIQYNGKQTEISTSGLSKGIYFVNIKERKTGKSYTLKLIKD